MNGFLQSFWCYIHIYYIFILLQLLYLSFIYSLLFMVYLIYVLCDCIMWYNSSFIILWWSMQYTLAVVYYCEEWEWAGGVNDLNPNKTFCFIWMLFIYFLLFISCLLHNFYCYFTCVLWVVGVVVSFFLSSFVVYIYICVNIHMCLLNACESSAFFIILGCLVGMFW